MLLVLETIQLVLNTFNLITGHCNTSVLEILAHKKINTRPVIWYTSSARKEWNSCEHLSSVAFHKLQQIKNHCMHLSANRNLLITLKPTKVCYCCLSKESDLRRENWELRKCRRRSPLIISLSLHICDWEEKTAPLSHRGDCDVHTIKYKIKYQLPPVLREGFAAGTRLVLAGTGAGAGQVEVVRAVSVKRATHARCPAHVRGEDVHVDERQIRSDHHSRPTSKYQL